MKNKGLKKPAANSVNQAFANSEEKTSTVIANSKHHKKPKKQYL